MQSKGFLLLFTLLFAGFVGFYQYDRAQSYLVLAHNLQPNHPVHKAMSYFRDRLHEKSNGEIVVKIYPSGQLGTERQVLELMQIGAVAMTKVSSMSLESFSPIYGILNLPYIFHSKKHYYKVLDSSLGEKILASSRDKKFMGLTFYDGGARSFYTTKPILHPDDLKDLKIRVMGSQSAIEMVKLLGGNPTPMSYGEIYTGLQQGVIDGAESNITALTLGRHGEVIKNFSVNEHTMLPDVLLMSDVVWREFSKTEQRWIKTAAEESKLYQRRLWQASIQKAMQQAKNKLGVRIQYPQKAPFIERVQPMHLKMAQKSPRFHKFIEAIKEQANKP